MASISSRPQWVKPKNWKKAGIFTNLVSRFSLILTKIWFSIECKWFYGTNLNINRVMAVFSPQPLKKWFFFWNFFAKVTHPPPPHPPGRVKKNVKMRNFCNGFSKMMMSTLKQEACGPKQLRCWLKLWWNFQVYFLDSKFLIRFEISKMGWWHTDIWIHSSYYPLDPYTSACSRKGHGYQRQTHVHFCSKSIGCRTSVICLFKNFILKIHGQGHACGQRCWPWKLKVKDTPNGSIWGKQSALFY